MPVTAASLRANFPAFADAAVYPDSAINYWLSLAGKLLNVDRWGDLLDDGSQLFVAHNLVLEKQSAEAARDGNDPGEQTGPTASKAVGPVNVSYDTQAAIELNAGHWNMTTYGTRFIRLARMVGAGPVQLGIGSAPAGSSGPWAGPFPWGLW